MKYKDLIFDQIFHVRLQHECNPRYIISFVHLIFRVTMLTSCVLCYHFYHMGGGMVSQWKIYIENINFGGSNDRSKLLPFKQITSEDIAKKFSC